ncbi:MAG: hypothetical protein M3323_03145 [Actinomycetota bacterium]|nr:hypothetical protein [Actinomycetota bacterium]
MSTDLRLALPNRPGTVIAACDALAAAGVAVEGVCGDLRPGERWGYLHFLVDDGDAGRAALERAGLEIAAEHDVEVCGVDGSSGMLAVLARYRDDDRNVEVFYSTLDGRIVVATEDMRRERPGVKVKDAKY